MFDWVYLIPLAPFIMVVLIVWMQNQRKITEKQLEATAGQSAEKAAQYASRVQELEDRVKVLERIVTDKGYDIATQIEALRDQRAVDEGNGVPLNVSKRETAR
ncbi:hypothetical protein [Aurantiacibacter poecillastricola]|uniref:hypothetical protein n=1 Tax=Aurantiacibacter poecillastricola TaxID=3064385 RepID=UPI00273FA3DF|nr:hypothetical protein [Aurantiacibacter sp. 219JJ12-13]MDP5262981.1 hypothetical protein [Aurantiacibacter sp. 219JJ12-13]